MKEIFHDDNKRLDAVNKIRAEGREVIGDNGYLEYADTSVRQNTSSWFIHTRTDSVADFVTTTENAVRSCHVGRDSATRHGLPCRSDGGGRRRCASGSA